MKLKYTQIGDKGMTKSWDGKNHWKGEPVFDILGGIDRLSSMMGAVHMMAIEADDQRYIEEIQIVFFSMMGLISGPPSEEAKIDHETKVEEAYRKLAALTHAVLDEAPEQTTWVVYGKGGRDAFILDRLGTEVREVERLLCKNDSPGIIVQFFNALSKYFYGLARKYDVK